MAQSLTGREVRAFDKLENSFKILKIYVDKNIINKKLHACSARRSTLWLPMHKCVHARFVFITIMLFINILRHRIEKIHCIQCFHKQKYHAQTTL